MHSKLILNNINSGILMEDGKRKVLFINQFFCTLFQIPVEPDLLIGADCEHAAQASAPLFEDPEYFIESTLKIISDKQKVTNQTLRLKDGNVYARDYIPINNPKMKSKHLWLYRDVTVNENLQLQIEKQKMFYEKILNNIPADIAIFSPEHKYLFVNHFGISDVKMREWIIGKDDYDYARFKNIDFIKANERRAIFQEALRSGKIQTFEESFIKKNGEEAFKLRNFYPYKNEEEVIEFIIGYGLDITSLKQKESQLQKAKEEREQIFNSLDEILFVLDKDHKVLFTNHAWEATLGYTSADTVGKNLFEFFNKKNGLILQKQINVAKAGKKVEERKKISITTRYGFKKHFAANFISTTSALTSENIVVGFLTDITEQIKALTEMESLVEKEKQLNDLKSGFVNMASHELRTPLSIILSSCEIAEQLVSTELNAEKAEEITFHLKRITSKVDEMTELMNGLLMVSRVEGGKIKFRPEQVDIIEFLKEVLSSYMPWKDGRNLHIAIKGQRQPVEADTFMMKHLLTNVLENAFKYSVGKSSPSMRIRFSKNNFTISVVDAGIGIPAKELQQLFTPFTRASNVADISGTGLGLVVLKYFTENHSGTVQVKSIQNKGSIFYLTFPYKTV